MRKLVALLLAALLLLTVTACGNQSSGGNKKPKPTKPTIQSVLIVTERVSVRTLCFFIHILRSLFGSYGSS